MTRPVQDLLSTFDQLSPQDQHAAAVAILRRVDVTADELTDETLDRLADELFETLDAAEASDSNPAAR